ncbi:Protein CBG03417 [Caenorhabditis briggsae]|uniref:Protein CBG03417 n=2 Tax=Caenorhabditis briggsae TaxID=6238 RepID=A8WV05_CAEBR|nr:Protein CBG03417 [Caenorhabditis briggsae]CAP24316.1 Protein CBG03417 [Caenorhabditis briggsae]
MDDDYNVLSTGFDEDDGALHYPDDEGEQLAVVSNTENQIGQEVRNALEEVGYGTRKRRLNDVEDVFDKYGRRSHPMDWFERSETVSINVLQNSQRNAAKRRALEVLEQQINETVVEAAKVNVRDDDEGERDGEQTISSLCERELQRRYQRKKEIMKNPPVDGSNWIGLWDVIDGKRFYIRTFRENQTATSLVESITQQATRSRVGYRAFQTICQEAENIRKTKEANRINEQESEFSQMMNESLPVHSESSLWVNKYEAKNFADLLSDSTVNRNILTWLKMWDECVFQRKVDNLLASLGEREKDVLQMDNGKIRRPSMKMLLLSGPAGLGKSTLARIVASQAGYATIDVNASDARTVADLNKVLEGAVKTSRTLDGDQRPACLILDEIDGTPIDTIRHLIRCLQATGKKAVRRPIIGICNNLYTPALRDLRGVAWCVQLSATKQDALAKRLEQICDMENLRCDLSTLRKLCDLCANDMRHSINTLQWAAVASNKTKRSITMKLIHEVVEKEKGGAASIFEHWSSILELSKHVDAKGGIKNTRERVFVIERIAAEHGGEERFVSGLHANYMVSLPIGVIRKASSWFLFYDDMQKIIHSLQNWSVQKYASSFFVSLHLSLATHARVSIAYPQLEQTIYQKSKESEETISDVRSCGHFGRQTQRNELVLDILPYIVKIAQPPIKPMNESLYNQRELSIFNQTVSVMCDYGLTYTATMIKDQINWLFTPAIDVLTMFPLEEPKRPYLANATRQLIAHKITLTRVRLADHTPQQQSERITTNTDKIKEIIDTENQKKKKRLSAGAMKRKEQGKHSDVIFTHQDGDSNAVKKKVTIQQLNSIIFGES